ncbi:MAG: DMT family transporter [Candidatus Rokubacteria bacterium]|nr:DMT family transporter [Candidatus Rokubacteria bacterium]
MPRPSQTRAYAALILIVTLWGSYPAATKLALQDFPPFFLGAVRCTIASGFLLLLLARAGADAARALTPAALGSFLVLGISGIAVSTQLSYVAIYYTTAANTAILQAATPVMVALGARFYLGERLRRAQWAGVALSALGVLVVITNGRLAALTPQELRAGDFINLVALAGWAAYTVYGTRVLATHSPMLATTAAYVLGTLLLIPTAILTAPLFPAPRLGSGLAWGFVLYQALAGAVAHIWWYRSVDVIGPSRSAIFMNLQPVVGLALARGILAERIGLWQVVGTALVLGGVALTTRGSGR